LLVAFPFIKTLKNSPKWPKKKWAEMAQNVLNRLRTFQNGPKQQQTAQNGPKLPVMALGLSG
jgi:hypothetical protein